MAEQVGILHNCRAQLEFEQPFIDQFEIVFEQDLRQSFPALAALDESTSLGQLLLRKSICPHEEIILAALQELKVLQIIARKSAKPTVICHTDLHGGNLMTDDAGRLYILDWENALIAPPEHDLFFFAGEKNFFEVFWPRYAHHFQTASVDPDILRFYFYRRALEDIADFILRILRRDGSPERDREDIGWMMECITGLDQIEDAVAKIADGFRTS